MEREQLPLQTTKEIGEEKARLIGRYIETHIVGKNERIDAEEENEIQKYYKGLSSREKTDILYNKIMAYRVDQQAKKTDGKSVAEKPDPYLVSEIKVLFDDPEVKKLFLSAYGEARADTKELRASDLANLWEKTLEEINSKGEIFRQLEKDLNLNKIIGVGNISAARSRMTRLAENISSLEKRKNEMETLNGFSETTENTDMVANFQYKNLQEYKKQLDKGFVWLPSRKVIHQKTVSAILNHRWPVLIGEAGSGKSQQADAAALELTGHLPTEIECESVTGEIQLIKDNAIDPETGGSYEVYGPLMRAFTGYDDARQQLPTIKEGRIARFDESGRLGPKAYSIIKKARQKKPGDDFYGRPMLPGAGAIWTSNPVGPRYPDRHAPDPAMRRELAEIHVDYPEMTIENPEIYEFALAALENENYHIAVAKKELAPAYEKKEVPEKDRKILEDGSIIIAKDEIIRNMADNRHGALWRFSAAIKSLQDSFVYGNAETESYPDTLLRFKEDTNEKIEIKTDGSGEPLTLSTSTVTLGELASWMKGFNERREKQDIKFRVNTFTEWLNFKIATYLDQADKADKGKLEAIFKHFGFLDKSIIPDLTNAKLLTPKDIGYLSPRVPRPVYLEKPVVLPTQESQPNKVDIKTAKENINWKVLLEDGSEVLVKFSEFTLPNGVFDLKENKNIDLEIKDGKKFRVGDEVFVFAGVVEDATSPNNNQPVGQFANEENLYKIFTSEELFWGIEEEFKKESVGETGIDDMKEDLLSFWEMEDCKNTCGEFAF